MLKDILINIEFLTKFNTFKIKDYLDLNKILRKKMIPF